VKKSIIRQQDFRIHREALEYGGWCNPDAIGNIPENSAIEYAWSGSYDSNERFTALYRFQVPQDAEPGVYSFGEGWLEYYVESDGPYVADIAGDTTVTVR